MSLNTSARLNVRCNVNKLHVSVCRILEESFGISDLLNFAGWFALSGKLGVNRVISQSAERRWKRQKCGLTFSPLDPGSPFRPGRPGGP